MRVEDTIIWIVHWLKLAIETIGALVAMIELVGRIAVLRLALARDFQLGTGLNYFLSQEVESERRVRQAERQVASE